MLTQVEIRTLSGELPYGDDGKQVLPELCGSILLPKNSEMLMRVCEHRKRVIDGTFRSKPLSDEILRKYQLRPEYARSNARPLTPAPLTSNNERERAENRRRANAILEEERDRVGKQQIIDDYEQTQRNRLLVTLI